VPGRGDRHDHRVNSKALLICKINLLGAANHYSSGSLIKSKMDSICFFKSIYHSNRCGTKFKADADLLFHSRSLISPVPVRDGINFLERRQVQNRSTYISWFVVSQQITYISRSQLICCLLFAVRWQRKIGTKEIRFAGNHPRTVKLMLLSALAKI
jgi:hypothetical protein